MMFVATLVGLFLTSVLIGVVASAIESKLYDLRKGNSIVKAQGHTVIIGFNDNVYALLTELIEANANHKNSCVVVLGEQGKEEMEDSIAAHISDTKTTRIICRSGGLYKPFSLQRCSVEKSRSVIINVLEDKNTVKIILALTEYLKGKRLFSADLFFVATIRDRDSMEAARLAGEGRAELIYPKAAIARIIANTCRQHGLSQVFTELFNFAGNELYIETVPEMAGKTFVEAMHCFTNAMLVGLVDESGARLNPPKDTVIGEKDKMILFEEDDGAYILSEPVAVEKSLICEGGSETVQKNNHLLILGSNDKLPLILAEYDRYVSHGTRVIIVDSDIKGEYISDYRNLNISLCTRPITRALLWEFLQESIDNVLLLNDDSEDGETSDAKTLLHLILLRDIAEKTGRRFAITTEMKHADNQTLATRARVDDFVISSKFISLLMAQISDNRLLLPLISNLLDEEGVELYMKPAGNYVQLGKCVDSYILTQSAAQKGEIYIGYRCMGTETEKVVVNPIKKDAVIFKEGDMIVVIAEN